MNIAMWSGPRNLSTAMMRSFGSRSDCSVWDEPFYAAYLNATGSEHPMAAKIVTAYETNPGIIAQRCQQNSAKPLFYQKHMTHHMIAGFDRQWLKKVTNVFLIRHPYRVVASYAAKRESPELEDLGFIEQNELFKMVADWHGSAPLVVDAFDIRQNPRKVLANMCAALTIEFRPSMLSWPRGPQPEDGNWGEHWYEAVWNSTGFAAPEQRDLPALSGHLKRVADAALPIYTELTEFCLE